ncbi:MAG: N-acetyltransferase, partial [Paramuribaculum sp.]|nr:N-acetyltransferase [Paramuribaculum sp.]
TVTALLRRLIEACRRDNKPHALIACITADNDISRRLHEREGFRQVSEFKAVGLKLGCRLDVVDYELIVG